eukprot:4336692-Ditylum_brightwellii.AAC.1
MPTSKPAVFAVCDKLLLMMSKMQDNLSQDIQDLHQRQANRCNNFFNNYRTSTVVSNKEHQKQHQDLDATIKTQHIF